MELIEYIRLFRRRLWLIILMTFLAGSAGFVFRANQPDEYASQAMINIGGFILAPDPTSGEINAGQELALTYSEIVETYRVLQGTVDALSLDSITEDIRSGDSLRGLVDVNVLPATSLLTVEVTYTDPILAADIANEVAQQLLHNSPTNLTPEQQNQVDLANEQIALLTQQLTRSREQLDLIEIQRLSAENPLHVAELDSQQNSILAQINQATSSIASFSETLANLQQRTNSLEIIEEARVSGSPVGSGVLTTTLLAGLVGMMVAVGVILLEAYLNDTIDTSYQAAHILSTPVVGTVPKYGGRNDTYGDRLVDRLSFLSPVSESYRTVVTNLSLMRENQTATYVVTSPGVADGKSLTTANLGIATAWSGKRVLVIDCDLRRPRLHEIFELGNDIGLTTLLNARSENIFSDAEQIQSSLEMCIQSTELERLSVMTSGLPPKNPSDVLVSKLLSKWFEAIRDTDEYDVIIIDSPPVLIASDSSIVATAASAEILLVLNAGQTRRPSALKTKEHLELTNTRIGGVILNRANPRDERYYGYDYYSYYYHTGGQPSSLWGKFRNLFVRTSG